MKLAHHQLEKFHDCFLKKKKHYSFNLNNISKFQCSHYRNVSIIDPLGTGYCSLGICRAHFGNHWFTGSVSLT